MLISKREKVSRSIDSGVSDNAQMSATEIRKGTNMGDNNDYCVVRYLDDERVRLLIHADLPSAERFQAEQYALNDGADYVIETMED